MVDQLIVVHDVSEGRGRRLERLPDCLRPGCVGNDMSDRRRRLERLSDGVGSGLVGDDVHVRMLLVVIRRGTR